MSYSLDLGELIREDTYSWQRVEESNCCVLRGVVYCSEPVNAFYGDGKLFESMIICAPAAYINEDGTINREGICGDYTGATAPIVFKNNCQGWLSSIPEFDRDDCVTTAFDYAKQGFVYVGCGARSRNIPEGKAPNPVVDLKAGVRFLRLNADAIPGNCKRIFSYGGSGAGEMSSVLGASGNMEQFFPYLYEIGAAGVKKEGGEYISTVSDAVDGCAVFYAIGDIENIDLAYAWTRFDTGETEIRKRRPGPGGAPETIKFSDFKMQLQNDLAQEFCEYVNDLQLVDENGKSLSFDFDPFTGKFAPRSGGYYERVLKELSSAFMKFLAQEPDPDAFVFENYGLKNADGISVLPDWLERNGKEYKVTDLAGYLNGTGLKRNKDIPSFDVMDRSAENNAFGAFGEKAVHFSRSDAKVMEKNYAAYAQLQGFDKSVADEYIHEANRPDIVYETYLMNAVGILLDCKAGKINCDSAPLWRIRLGTADQHSPIPVNLNLALAAAMNGAEETDFSLVWNMPHGCEKEGTSAGTFIEWVNALCRDGKISC